MKKILNYISTLIYFYLLILFSLIAHSFANDDYVFYSIIIMIISLFVTCLSFMLNRSKKIIVRRYYLFTMTLTSIYVILCGFKCLFYNTLNNVVYNWIIYFVFAGIISFYLFELFFTFKPLFKKNYELEKFDYQNFIMLINALAFGLVAFFLFYKVDLSYIDAHNDFSKYSLIFNEIKWPIVYITIGYTLIYAIVSILYYKNIEKKNK